MNQTEQLLTELLAATKAARLEAREHATLIMNQTEQLMTKLLAATKDASLDAREHAMASLAMQVARSKGRSLVRLADVIEANAGMDWVKVFLDLQAHGPNNEIEFGAKFLDMYGINEQLTGNMTALEIAKILQGNGKIDRATTIIEQTPFRPDHVFKSLIEVRAAVCLLARYTPRLRAPEDRVLPKNRRNKDTGTFSPAPKSQPRGEGGTFTKRNPDRRKKSPVKSK
jgi:hypothetical protein